MQLGTAMSKEALHDSSQDEQLKALELRSTREYVIEHREELGHLS